MANQQQRINALTIAGSDSSGGAGLQADLRTFSLFGLHGLSVVTAVTAQSLHRVASIHAVPARTVEQQLRVLCADFRIAAVKIGMLATAPTVARVAALLQQRRLRNVVLDPVLAASSGTPLLSPRGIAVLRERLIPLAEVFTPNLPEAEILLGRSIRAADAPQAARDLLAFGARAVLLKGGHGRGPIVRDFLADASGVRQFQHERQPVRARGTGCVLASAIAAGLARGQSVHAAVAGAQRYLQRALRNSYRPGGRMISVLPG